MYRAKIFGKVVKLSDKDFKQIVRKYDIVNAVNSREGYTDDMEINVDCSLCNKFMGNCSNCPFGKFVPGATCGCVEAAKLIVGKDVSLSDWGTIMGTPEDVIHVEKIHRFLLKKFKKV